MRIKLSLVVALFLLGHASLAQDAQREDQLVWDYAEFLGAFSARDWSRAQKFLRPDTKIGFGGAEGLKGLRESFGDDKTCHRAMLRALELGCKKTGKGRDMQCLAPPHYADPDVVYLGARASFKYSEAGNVWALEFLVCGGD